MAKVKGVNGKQLLIQIGDGADPEAFTHDCLINTERGIAFSSEETRQTVPDCDDTDAPAWSVVTKDGLSASITGSGMLHTPSIEDWYAWMNSDDAKNIRVLVNVPGADGGGHWAGQAKLMSFEVTGSRSEYSTVSITLGSHGEFVWVPKA